MLSEHFSMQRTEAVPLTDNLPPKSFENLMDFLLYDLCQSAFVSAKGITACRIVFIRNTKNNLTLHITENIMVCICREECAYGKKRTSEIG